MRGSQKKAIPLIYSECPLKALPPMPRQTFHQYFRHKRDCASRSSLLTSAMRSRLKDGLSAGFSFEIAGKACLLKAADIAPCVSFDWLKAARTGRRAAAAPLAATPENKALGNRSNTLTIYLFMAKRELEFHSFSMNTWRTFRNAGVVPASRLYYSLPLGIRLSNRVRTFTTSL